MPGVEMLFELMKGVHELEEGSEKLEAPHAGVSERIEGQLESGSGALGIAGRLAGGAIPEGASVGTAFLGSGLGGALLAASGVLGAGAMGFGIGTALDDAFGLSDQLSDTMAGGSIDDRLLLGGVIGTGHPGAPTDGERRQAAARLPGLEAERQEEIGELVQASTRGHRNLFGGVGAMAADAELASRHGIDMEKIRADEQAVRERQEHSPEAQLRRETERQVQLAHAIQARDAAPAPFARQFADAEIVRLLGHYAE